jgi:phage-related protein
MGIGDFFGSVWDGIKHLGSSIASVPATVAHAVSGAFTSVKNSISHFGNNIIDTAKKAAVYVGQKAKDVATSAEKVISNVYNDGKSLIAGTGSLISTPLMIMAGAVGIGVVIWAWSESRKV